MDVRFSIALPREAYTVAVVREFVGEALRAHGICDECAFRILLAASEACGNAVDHGAPARDYSVTTHLHSASCVVEISHKGTGFTAARVPPPRLDAESGRGILLMRHLVDEVDFSGSPQGDTTVRLCKTLHQGADGAAGCGRVPEPALC
ncbi:ATP-binding protein [Nocardiopsis trehalosi]|jgi:serine/threonine-protein kinase RsbW|uniref:ATP-binding protein n=1 Tax=Nocardiopsis trehalosi TaxID=109329 RepID=UPI000AC5DE4A|nr:ATP-binding protein [Nocardiopsis trehalosi]